MSETTLQAATLGGGCFWCLEASYQLIKGVEKIVSGYAGGGSENPTYEEVSTGTTGHAEVVQIDFDPEVISYKDILDIFWALHDPTTKDRQGTDVGSQYRSVIFYHNDDQRKAAEESRAEIAKFWPNTIVTTIEPLKDFYQAEDYHQNYFMNHPEQSYCQIVINPKLEKLRQKFEAKLK